MPSFRAPELSRDQILLIPVSLNESIPPDHRARYVLRLLESGAFSEPLRKLEAEYSVGLGRPSYHPRYLAGLLIYGMLVGIRSSRRLEEACSNRIDFKFLMEAQRPDHATIAAFFKRHADSLKEMLTTTLAIGSQAGLLRLNRVAIDGTRVKARGSKESVRSRKAIEKSLEAASEVVAQFQEEFVANEMRESQTAAVAWQDKPQDGSAKAHARAAKKIKACERALQELEKRKDSASRSSRPPSENVSVTDPESRPMKGKDDSFGPHYNAQIAVDVDSGMVVAVDLNDEPHDSGFLASMTAQVTANCNQNPQAVLADSAYSSGADLQELKDNGIEAYVPDPDQRNTNEAQVNEVRERVARGEACDEIEAASLPRGRNGRISRNCFVYNESQDSYACPGGRTLTFRRTQTQQLKGTTVKRRCYDAGDCTGCPLIKVCCAPTTTVRTISRDQYDAVRSEVRARMSTPEGAEIYKARSHSVEGRIAQATNQLGVRRSNRFGKRGTAAQWCLAAIAINFSVLVAHWDQIGPVI